MQFTNARARLVTTGLALTLALGAADTASADGPANKIFGYESTMAGAAGRILEYDIDRDSTVEFRRSCVPNPAPSNGRGIALDARQGPDAPNPGGAATRVLYNTFIMAGAAGDGLIHRNTLPSDGCQPLTPIPLGEGAGPPNQDDVGALDFHETDDGGKGQGQDTDILYAAGYLSVNDTGSHFGDKQILFKLDAETGEILGRCAGPARTAGFGGNDTLTFARLKIGGRTREVLLTDFGEFRQFTSPYSLSAVDERSLLPGEAPAPPCAILQEFPEPLANGGRGVITGADFEKIPKPGGGAVETLVAHGVFETIPILGVVGDPESANFYDTPQPFPTGRLMGPTEPSDDLEDSTVERVEP